MTPPASGTRLLCLLLVVSGILMAQTLAAECTLANCETCDPAGIVCEKCIEGFSENNNICAKCLIDGCETCEIESAGPTCRACYRGFIRNGDTPCQWFMQCENCNTCEIKDEKPVCAECSKGFIRLNGICKEIKDECRDINKFQNPKTSDCSNCNDTKAGGIENCRACRLKPIIEEADTVFVECTICQNEFNLSSEACVTGTGGTVNCPQDCATCKDFEKYFECQTCNTGFVVQHLRCVPDCEAGPSNLSKCAQCHQESSWVCDQCNEGYGFVTDTTCTQLNVCEAGKYLDDSNTCQDCATNCLLCNATSCFYCNILDGFKVDDSGMCIKSDFTPTVADICGGNCKTCEFNTQRYLPDCTACEDGFTLMYILNNGTEVKTQPDSPDLLDYLIKCVLDCSQSDCNQCYKDADKTKCNLCNDGYRLSSISTCVLCRCDEGQFCQLSTSNVKSCTACNKLDTNCTICMFDLELQLPVCTFCATNFHQPYLNGPCEATDSQDTSDQKCPRGSYFKEVSCVPCRKGCASCTYVVAQTFARCDVCQTGLTLNAGICKFTQAPGGEGCLTREIWSKTSQGCESCQEGCQVCTYNEAEQIPFCVLCENKTDWFLDKMEGRCYNLRCLPSFSFNRELKQCQFCGTGCQKCQTNFETGSVECVICEEGHDQANGACTFKTGECTGVQWTDGFQCLDCPMGCSTCMASEPNEYGFKEAKCTACKDSLTVQDGRCVNASCGDKMFYGPADGSTKGAECQSCPAECSTCTFKFREFQVACTGCAENFTQEGDFCLQNLSEWDGCTGSQAEIIDRKGNPTCKECPGTCKGCIFDPYVQDFRCNECNAPYKFDDDQFKCVPTTKPTCTATQYYNDQDATCQKCPKNCATCFLRKSPLGEPQVICDSCTKELKSKFGECQAACDQGKRKNLDADTKADTPCLTCSEKCEACETVKQNDRPVERCRKCAEGQYPAEDGCRSVGKCPKTSGDKDQYVQYYQHPDGYFEQFCFECQEGCLACYLEDPFKSFTEISCGSCGTDFKKVNWWCEPTAASGGETLVECEEGNYQSWSLSTGNFQGCQPCPDTNCKQCFIADFCEECKTGFVKQGEEGKCSALPNCAEGMYSAPDREVWDNPEFQCKPCPDGCSACTFFENGWPYAKCSACTGPKVLQDGKCVIQYPGYLKADQCATGQFPTRVGTYIECFECSENCSKCGWAYNNDGQFVPNDKGRVSCTNCFTGTTKTEGGWCETTCVDNTYVKLLNKEFNGCGKCHISCQGCSGPTSKDCLDCQLGFVYGPEGCTEEEKKQNNCGHEAYLDDLSKKCVCFDTTRIFTENKCQTRLELGKKSGCKEGQYHDGSVCRRCKSSSTDKSDTQGQARCTACTGGSPSQCVLCTEGYFLDEKNNCTKCKASNCAQCSTVNSCDKCVAGFYYSYTQNALGEFGLQCSNTCPTGYLGTEESLYFNNPQVFDLDTLWDNLKSDPEPPKKLTGSAIAKAIGIFGEPKAAQEWTIAKQLNYYNEVLVNIECRPCFLSCANCASDLFYYPTEKSCHHQCPDGTYVSTTNEKECAAATSDDALKGRISVLTVNFQLPAFQPKNKELFAEVQHNKGDSAGVTFEWSVSSVKKDVDGQKKAGLSTAATLLNTQEEQRLKQTFVQGVITDEQFIFVPADNLRRNIIYTLTCKVTLSETTITVQEDVLVRASKSKQTFNDLFGSVDDKLIVSPQEGVSGETDFIAEIKLSSNSLTTSANSNPWQFSIQIGEDLIVDCTVLPCQKEFKVSGDANGDQEVFIFFTISNGVDIFHTERQILAKANSSYNPLQSDNLKKLNSQASTDTKVKVSEVDLAQAVGGLLKLVNSRRNTCEYKKSYKSTDLSQFGPCNQDTKESTGVCCGQGTCTEIGTTLTFKCDCAAGRYGQFCDISLSDAEIKEISTNADFFIRLIEGGQVKLTVNTVISLKNIVKFGILTPAQLIKIIGILGGFVENTGTADIQLIEAIIDVLPILSEYLGTLFASQDSTTASVEEAESKKGELRTQMTKSASKLVAGTISKSNREIEKTVGDSQVKAKLVNTKDKKGATNSMAKQFGDKTAGSNFGFAKEAFDDKTKEPIMMSMMSPPGSLGSSTDKKVPSPTLELSIIDKSGAAKKLSNLQGECPVSYSMQFTEDSTDPYECVWYDFDTNKFSNEGCKLTSTQKDEKTKEVTVNCCCTHATTFASGQAPATRNPTPTPTPTPTTPTSGEYHLQVCFALIAIIASTLIN